MKTLATTLAALLVSLSVATTAWAGTLSNEDGQKYDLTVKNPGSTTQTSIGGHTTQMATCAGFPCSIVNRSTGDSVKLTESKQHVVIRKGKFVVR